MLMPFFGVLYVTIRVPFVVSKVDKLSIKLSLRHVDE